MDKIRVGIVGMGQRVCYHGGVLFGECKDEVQVAGVCDNKPEHLARGKRIYEQAFGYDIPAYADYSEMFAKAGLQAALIAGPNYLHRDMALAAFDHGLHVLCEKPMEVTLPKCDEMIAAARKKNLVFAICLQMHYRLRYHKIKQIIQEGRIGRVVQLWCTEYRGPFGPAKNWVWRRENSGGAIVEKNCHHYDLMNWWAASEPTTVYASGSTLKHHEPHGFKSEIVDNAWIISDYANGARAMLGINFMASSQMDHKREFGIIGTEGRIFINWDDGEIIHVRLTSGQEEHLDYRNPEWVGGGINADFLRCIRTGAQPMVTAEMGRSSLLVPMAAEISMREKRVVNVSELK